MTAKIKKTVGVLALQGSYHEHMAHLEALFDSLAKNQRYSKYIFTAKEVKTTKDLSELDGLIFPGGESTTMSILLQRNGLLDPIRHLVQVDRLPCWGTCAGLILLSNEIVNTKIDLGGTTVENSMKYRVIGGLDVQIQRNSFGRQLDSFNKSFQLDAFDGELHGAKFPCIFIRAPVIKRILDVDACSNKNLVEHDYQEQVVRSVILTTNRSNVSKPQTLLQIPQSDGDNLIVAIKQDNIFGTSFHPELVVGDYRMHKWFIDEFVLKKA